MSAPRSRDEVIPEDVPDLARLGYAQQLYRETGGFSNFAISSQGCRTGYGLQFGAQEL